MIHHLEAFMIRNSIKMLFYWSEVKLALWGHHHGKIQHGRHQVWCTS